MFNDVYVFCKLFKGICKNKGSRIQFFLIKRNWIEWNYYRLVQIIFFNILGSLEIWEIIFSYVSILYSFEK